MSLFQKQPKKLGFLEHLFKTNPCKLNIIFKIIQKMQNTYYKNVQPLEDFDWESLSDDKYNNKVKLSKADEKNGTRVLCKEPYAQELYEKYRQYESEQGINLHISKDLTIGNLYSVTAHSICFKTNTIKAAEVNSGVEISIPFKEYGGDLELLQTGS